MILRKEYKKPQCIKKAGIVLTENVHLNPLKVILLTHKNIIKMYLITVWFAHETNK